MSNNVLDTFHNSSRVLAYMSEGSTPTAVMIPTLTFDETPVEKEETWFSSGDVPATGSNAGTAFESGTVGGLGKSYKVETKMFKTADATPALNAALATLRATKNQIGLGRRLTFVIVEPDGTAEQCNCDVMAITTIKGPTENSAAFTFDLHRRGAPSTFSGTITGQPPVV